MTLERSKTPGLWVATSYNDKIIDYPKGPVSSVGGFRLEALSRNRPAEGGKSSLPTLIRQAGVPRGRVGKPTEKGSVPRRAGWRRKDAEGAEGSGLAPVAN